MLPQPDTSGLHAGLDLASLAATPAAGFGEVFDVTNATIYALEGDHKNAAISVVGAVPYAGGIAIAARLLRNAAGTTSILPATALATTVTDTMAAVRTAGRTGEQMAGIVHNTQRIPSLSGSAAYRIPDVLNSTTLGEVKNVRYLSYTAQLRDFHLYAQQNGLQFVLYARPTTVLSGPLQQLVDSGEILLDTSRLPS